ncbi:polyadenylate-binding protein 2 [Pelomyxa schiedti]|nr:polyadenylate-binding protein 2 [Pelomyxa schiedti]
MDRAEYEDVAEEEGDLEEDLAAAIKRGPPVHVDPSRAGAGSSIPPPPDPAFEELKQGLQTMEAEVQQLAVIQRQQEQQMQGGAATHANKAEVDAKSVFVANVDWSATPEEIQAHFLQCGKVSRVTIMYDQFTSRPKGFAYVEFLEKESVANALALTGSEFKGRQLKVILKRTNIPGFKSRRRRRFASPYDFPPAAYFPWMPAPMPMARPRFRARRNASYHPYS